MKSKCSKSSLKSRPQTLLPNLKFIQITGNSARYIFQNPTVSGSITKLKETTLTGIPLY